MKSMLKTIYNSFIMICLWNNSYLLNFLDFQQCIVGSGDWTQSHSWVGQVKTYDGSYVDDSVNKVPASMGIWVWIPAPTCKLGFAYTPSADRFR